MNEREITSHKVNGDYIEFFHFTRDFVPNKGWTDWQEKEWFKFKPYNPKEVALISNEVLYGGYPMGCLGKHLMEYLRKCKSAKLISSKEIPNYEESPYGRSVQMGYYTYEIWDLSSILK